MTKIEFISILGESKNKRDLLFRLGRKDNGAGVRFLDKLLKEFDVDISSILKRKTRDIEKRCLFCNKLFPSSDGVKGRKCCSVECATKYAQTFVDTKKISTTLKKLYKNGEIKLPDNSGRFLAARSKYSCTECKRTFEQTIAQSNTNKICVCSKECREKLLPKVQSENLKRQYKNGKKVFGGKTKWFRYKDIKVQGTYELRACRIFDEMVKRGEITSWEYSPCRAEYVGVDNSTHTYLIDFRVNNNDGTFYFVETKGRVRENDQLKWEAVRNSGHNLLVWFLKDITEKENNLFGQ